MGVSFLSWERKPVKGKIKWKYGEERTFVFDGKEYKVPLGELELHPSLGYWLAEALVEHGVDTVFGVVGGHIFQIHDWVSRLGIHWVTVRHEQDAVYAAEAYAKAKRKPGIVIVTAGPGLANTFPAVHQNKMAEAPIIIISGGHEFEHDKLYTTIQENVSESFYPVVKLYLRIVHPSQAKQFIARAFKEALTPPYGTVLLEVSVSALITPCPPKYPYLTSFGVYGIHANYIENWRKDRVSEPYTWGPNPKLLEKAVKLLFEAKAPVMLLGNEVYWDDAGPEIAEFCEMAKIPVSCRRLARGCINEKSPIHFGSRAYPPVFERADLVTLVGTKIGFFDGWGAGWRRCIQVTNHPVHLWTWLPTEVEVLGNIKVTFEQMLKYAKENKLEPPPEREEWFKAVRGFEATQRERAIGRAKKYSNLAPLHPAWFCYVLSEYLDKRYNQENPIIVDGYCLSDFYPIYSRPTTPGPYLDASEQAGVGHGLGMVLGLHLANPEKLKKSPAVVLLGDAGVGIAGFEIETAVRERVSAVYVIWNNDGWAAGAKGQVYSTSRGKQWDVAGPANIEYGLTEFVKNIRYDKMFEQVGAHGEWLTEPSEEKIVEVLSRAFDAAEKGKPAVVNVDAEPTVDHRELGYSFMYCLLWTHIPWDELPRRHKAIRRSTLSAMFAFDKYGIPAMKMPDPWEPISEDEIRSD